LANAEILTILFSSYQKVSYPNNKTKHLIGMASMLGRKIFGQGAYDC
jgi:hypothetical protein